jgi:hypothetical protein
MEKLMNMEIIEVIEDHAILIYDRLNYQIGAISKIENSDRFDMEFRNNDRLNSYKNIDQASMMFLVEGGRVLNDWSYERCPTGEEILNELVNRFGGRD